MASIEIKGLDRLQKKLEAIGKPDVIRNGIKAAAAHIKGKIAQYPPATAANSPGEGRWYERGYGPKWMTRAGVHGRKTSETLGRKWTTTTRNNGMTGVVGNNVSYGPFVQSAEKQTWFHEAHGWKTDKRVIDEEKARVTQLLQAEIRKAINGK